MVFSKVSLQVDQLSNPNYLSIVSSNAVYDISEVWTRHLTWTWVRLKSHDDFRLNLTKSKKDLQLDFDFNTNDLWLNLDLSLLTRTDLIPSPSPNMKNYDFKKVFSVSTLHLTDYSLNRTAANQIVPAEKKLCVAVQRNVGEWIQMEPLERWYPKLLFSDIKTMLYQQKTDCNLQNMQEENYRRRRNNFQLCSTFEAAERTVSRG